MSVRRSRNVELYTRKELKSIRVKKHLERSAGLFRLRLHCTEQRVIFNFFRICVKVRCISK